MQDRPVTRTDFNRDRQLREELPGSWYNYEPSEITLDTQEFDHWLSRIVETMNSPTA